jgi:hypothetical protein
VQEHREVPAKLMEDLGLNGNGQAKKPQPEPEPVSADVEE